MDVQPRPAGGHASRDRPARGPEVEALRPFADRAPGFDALDDELRRLVVRRLRAGAWIVLFGSALLLGTDFALHRAELRALVAPKVALLSVTIATIWAMRQPFRLGVLRWIGAGLLTAAYLATALASAKLGDVTRTPLIAIVTAMAGTYAPLGVGPLLASLIGAWASIALNLWLVHRAGGSLAGFGYSGVAFASATVASLYVSAELRRTLVERRNAARALLERLGAEQEARVASALTRVGRELNASLDTAAIAEHLLSLTRELVGAASATLLLRDRSGGVFEVARAAGAVLADGVREVAAVELAPWIGRFAREPVIALEGSSAAARIALSLPPSAEMVYLVALYERDLVSGIVVATGASAAMDGGDQRVLAHGIGQIASTALANARLLEELKRASRLKSEFVSTMSHELRTPLHVILGNAEILADESVDAADRQRCVAGIRRAGRDLLTMVEDTLEIGRLDAGRSLTVLADVALRELWEDLRSGCADLVPAPGVRLEWEPPTGDGIVRTDRRKLVTVTKNLLGNAVKFTSRGSIRVELRASADALVLQVSDTGIGIEPERQGDVFEMFRQLDGSDSRAYSGAGLGLYIVRRLVADLGGTVALSSEPGRGSRFTVSLPAPLRFPGASPRC